MKKTFVIGFLLGFSVLSGADQIQTAGGWGQGCVSGNITCKSGRMIGCQATVVDRRQRSECSQRTGSVGIVHCVVYDHRGNILNQFLDRCP